MPEQYAEQFLPGRTAYHESHWPLYACDWTGLEWANLDLIAVGSFTEDQNNRVCAVFGAPI